MNEIRLVSLWSDPIFRIINAWAWCTKNICGFVAVYTPLGNSFSFGEGNNFIKRHQRGTAQDKQAVILNDLCFVVLSSFFFQLLTITNVFDYSLAGNFRCIVYRNSFLLCDGPWYLDIVICDLSIWKWCQNPCVRISG